MKSEICSPNCLMSEVCHDVSIEPALVPLTGEILPAGSNKADFGEDVKRHSLMSGFLIPTPKHIRTNLWTMSLTATNEKKTNITTSE